MIFRVATPYHFRVTASSILENGIGKLKHFGVWLAKHRRGAMMFGQCRHASDEERVITRFSRSGAHTDT
jgi:hypothetical protein